MKKTLVLWVLVLFVAISGYGQGSKKPLDFKAYNNWKSLSGQQVSDDGSWLAWTINPQEGDGRLFLRAWGASSDNKVFPRGSQPVFSPNCDYLAFRINPQADTVRKAKLDKVKTEKMPKDSLFIYVFKSDQVVKYANIKSFKLADEATSWMAFQLEAAKAEAKPEKKDSASSGKKEEKSKKKPEFNGQPLIVMNPVTRDSQNFPLVTEYAFSKHGKWLYMVSIREDSVKTSTIRVFDTKSGSARDIWEQVGVVKSIVSDEEGTRLAFLFSADTAKQKNFDLYLWTEKDREPVAIVKSGTPGLKDGRSVSENGRLSFSPNGERLFFGTAATVVSKKEGKDSLLADDRVSVDIWNWKEDVLQSIQLKQVDQDRKQTYQAVYNIRKNKMVQLGDSMFIENFRLLKQGDGDFALGIYDKPYRLNNSISSGSTKDVYLADINSGTLVRIFEKVEVSPQLSPTGKYLYWWEPADSSWYCYQVKEKTVKNLTHGLPVEFTVDIHDTPDEPGSFGSMGWSENDENLYLYDKYDIWKFDPAGRKEPVCVTAGYGRKNDISLRYQSLDPEEKFLDPAKDYLFTMRQVKTKKSGFCRFSLDKPEIRSIMLEDCSYGRVTKAKNADKLLWTRSTVSEYPDFWTGDIRFGDARKISSTNPEQSGYVWANVELMEWTDLDGATHQGLLYKPENLDPSRKYPMIVYFYERHSDGLHSYYGPRASASTVNPLEYASNGYMVFMPDIHFKIGLPGKSFYNAIMSGILELGKRPYVDMKHLGIQGQSWGGYGTAYMITQTGIFAAASPGAPVSNMTSAYGGIRNESGMVRQFQYEKTQSRIGGTLWEKPEYFIENSPLFYADRITTPCLIRHDDGDGAVPFSEGVQLFVALRRLGKPAWLVNYNGQPHNLSRQADKKDWSVRMMQFFDHYLKGAPAPDWMTKGVSAVDKPFSETWYRQFTEK